MSGPVLVHHRGDREVRPDLGTDPMIVRVAAPRRVVRAFHGRFSDELATLHDGDRDAQREEQRRHSG